LTESSYLSAAQMYKQCSSVEQMEAIPVPTVAIMLHLGHANRETGDSKWRHYSAKWPRPHPVNNPPTFFFLWDFLMHFFFALFQDHFHSRGHFAEQGNETLGGGKQVGCTVWV